jgi:hypothetical protein
MVSLKVAEREAERESKRREAEEERKRVEERNRARLHYPELNIALMDRRAEEGKATEDYHYSNEADMINIIVLGVRAKKYRELNNIPLNSPLRDHLNGIQISAITELQLRDKMFIEEGFDYNERKERLTKYFNIKFKSKLLIGEIGI